MNKKNKKKHSEFPWFPAVCVSRFILCPVVHDKYFVALN